MARLSVIDQQGRSRAPGTTRTRGGTTGIGDVMEKATDFIEQQRD